MDTEFFVSVELLSLDTLPTDSESTLGTGDSPPAPKVIGAICLAPNWPSIGYLYSREYWGKGYATEALQAYVAAFWSKYPDGHPSLQGEERDYLLAGTVDVNFASQDVLKKCGFEYWKTEEVERTKGVGNLTLCSYRYWRPSLGRNL